MTHLMHYTQAVKDMRGASAVWRREVDTLWHHCKFAEHGGVLTPQPASKQEWFGQVVGHRWWTTGVLRYGRELLALDKYIVEARISVKTSTRKPWLFIVFRAPECKVAIVVDLDSSEYALYSAHRRRELRGFTGKCFVGTPEPVRVICKTPMSLKKLVRRLQEKLAKQPDWQNALAGQELVIK